MVPNLQRASSSSGTFRRGEPCNTTLAIALRFGVTHEEILEAVEYTRRQLSEADLASKFPEHFEEFEHTDHAGNRHRAYRMDRGGMMWLASAYMGENAEARGVPQNRKAYAALLEFIADFNKIEAELGVEWKPDLT